jgi:hypothetical protein
MDATHARLEDAGDGRAGRSLSQRPARQRVLAAPSPPVVVGAGAGPVAGVDDVHRALRARDEEARPVGVAAHARTRITRLRLQERWVTTMPSARAMREARAGRAARTRASSCSMRTAMASTTMDSIKSFSSWSGPRGFGRTRRGHFL